MIDVRDLDVSAGGFSLKGISFEIPAGAYGVLMGKTGCGKTTVLEAICGLKQVTAGTIALAGRDVTALRPGERNIGFVPQDVALFSTMTVREHLAFGPTVHRWTRAERAAVVKELAHRLDIEALLERRPDGLSGGERQRVALGRALALRPPVLLLDEPLSALDEETRGTMMELLKGLQAEHGITVFHVTHSASEAKSLADCVFRMERGAIIAQ